MQDMPHRPATATSGELREQQAHAATSQGLSDMLRNAGASLAATAGVATAGTAAAVGSAFGRFIGSDASSGSKVARNYIKFPHDERAGMQRGNIMRLVAQALTQVCWHACFHSCCSLTFFELKPEIACCHSAGAC